MSDRKPIPRLAIAVLSALASTPLLILAQGWLADRAARTDEAQRNAVVVKERGDFPAFAEPTKGMILDVSGFGTVSDAPEAIARIKLGAKSPAYQPGSIAADVRRFVRGLPSPAPMGNGSRKTQLCTLEGPPVWSGRLVLIGGCLRIRFDGAEENGPLILGTTELHRDAEGYLAASLGMSGAEHEVRIGAPNTQFVGVGCSMNEPVPAPPALAKMCGVTTMRRVGLMRRRHYCTREDVSARRAMETADRAMQQRLALQRQQCLERVGNPTACPPGVGPGLPPPPPPGSASACVPPRT